MTEHHEAIADSFDVDQPRDPEWYKRAVFYEVLVRGFPGFRPATAPATCAG